MPFRQAIEGLEADVVTVAGVLAAGVAEAGNEETLRPSVGRR